MISKVTDFLYIGNTQLTRMSATLREIGITSVLKLYQSPPDWPDGFTLRDTPIPDGQPIPEGWLDECTDFISGEIDAGRTVLVVCGAGVSRSSTAVLAYLVSDGMSLRDAYQHLYKRHPAADPHPALWASLIKHFDLPYAVFDTLQWKIECQQG